MAHYLRVKNWKEWQHYKDRRPPWVKLHSKLLRDDHFNELCEGDQWQLVRIWMLASQATRFTLDEKDRIVPVVSSEEQTLRRAIHSLKRIPISRFVADGWLIAVPESALLELPQDLPAASGSLAEDTHDASEDASALLEAESQSHRGSERANLKAVTADYEIECEVDKILNRVNNADDETRNVLMSYARKLPLGTVAKVRESCDIKGKVGAGYAVNALKAELADLEEIA